jgi:Putative porin
LQADRFAAGNAPEFFHQVTGQNISNTLEDRERMRVRARLRLTARITQDVSASVRLVTGSLTDPVSTNQTLGQTGSKFSFALDRAFLRARSRTFLPWLTASAGRVPNPFFSTNLVWDDDLSFDGAALQASPPTDELRVWRPFAALGVFPLQDIESSAAVKAKSKWLLAAQAGVEWAPDYDTNAKIGLALYDFRNISGIRNDFQQTAFNRTAPDFRQKGNTLFNIANTAPASSLFALASDFRLLNLTGSVDLNLFNPVHVMLSGDYVKNIGFDRAKTLARTGAVLDADTTGYMAQLAVGMPTIETRGDWQLSLGYRRLGADAVPDAFTDSDFHLGGTNHKGFFLGAQYGLAKNVWLNARWMSSNEIRGLPLSIDAFQVYLNARF